MEPSAFLDRQYFATKGDIAGVISTNDVSELLDVCLRYLD